MTFPLQVLAPAIEEHADTWATLNMSQRAFPIQPNHGKPVVRVEQAGTVATGDVLVR